MPMTALAVVIYLAIVLAGCVVVSIADSFAGPEIATRLSISKAKAIFTQDVIFRSGKEIPLYTRVVDAEAPKAIVIPGRSNTLSMPLRHMDVPWDKFLSFINNLSKCFSSTGEASNADDMLWLMSRANYKPVIEYCGGTEIGGAFITGSMLQPQALASFSTPAMGSEVVILDERGVPVPANLSCTGECALNPTMLGASRILLNGSHFNVYFRNMPKHNGKVLRRHGDELERMQGGFYKALGRVDDTMNLGGIKVSSVEIEGVCNAADDVVLETAAVGVPPIGGGPERLFVVAVLKIESSRELSTELRRKFSLAMQQKLNPLFKVDTVVLAPSLPRTTSNKVMRRLLRDQFRVKSLL